MRKKLIVTYIILITFAIITTGYYSYLKSNEHYLNMIQKELVYKGELLIELVEFQEKNANLQQFAYEKSKVIDARITLIDSEGMVVADSEKDYKNMDNHKYREEVKKALSGNVGYSTRASETLKIDYIYMAMPINTKQISGVIRISIPLKDIKVLNYELFKMDVVGVLLGSISSIFMGIIIIDRITKPIDELKNAVISVAKGNYDKKIYVSSKDQVGQLASAFNEMSFDLKNNLDQLQKRNIELESIMSSMINGIIAVDNNYHIILENKVSYELLGLTSENILNLYIYDVIRNSKIYDVIEESLKYKKCTVEEFKHNNRILKIYANPIIESKSTKTIGALLVIQDISKIVALENMRKDFVSNVTHELKTPLTSISGFVETLKNGAIEDKKVAIRFLEIIDLETDRLTRLIQDILILSEIETKKELDVSEECNIKSICKSVVEILKSKAENKGLVIELIVENNLKKYYGNKDKILQLIINLTDNAIKYTEKGSVTLKCRQEKHKLVISVIDTGIGIDEDLIPRLFERFYRVDRGRSRNMGGTGLGLSIVKHIVESCNGKIEVISKKGEGSEFIVKLPC